MDFSLESNINNQSNFQTNSNELFKLEQFPLPQYIKNILAIGISKESIIFTTSTNEVYRYIRNKRDSLQQAYSFPIKKQKDKEDKPIIERAFKSSTSSSVFCEPSGNHTLIRYLGRMYYFNIKSIKLKELFTLKNISVIAVAWDERNANIFSTGPILISDNSYTIYEYRIDIDIDNNIKDKVVPLIKVDNTVCGLYVCILY